MDVVCRRIAQMISSITGVEPASACLQALLQILEATSALALEVSKQRALYKMERPSGSILNTDTMEAVSGCGSKDSVMGKSVLAVAFPAVTRWGTAAGIGYDRSTTLLKAQVLI